MDAYEALLQRRSIRKYLKKPVPMELIKKIMSAAIWAPSGSNTQPWRFYVVAGEKYEKLIQTIINASGPDTPSIEAYEAMIGDVEKDLLKIIEQGGSIEAGLRKLGEKAMQFARFGSVRFYQAPVAIIVATPKQMAGSSLSIGAAVQNLLVAAHAEGLGTCWLGMPLMYKDDIATILDIPEDEVLVTTVCLGYPDSASPINEIGRERLPFNETVHMLT